MVDQSGRLDLGGDAAGSETALFSDIDVRKQAVDIRHFFDQPGIGLCLGVFVVDAVNVAEDDERVRVPEFCGMGAKGIVIADFNFIDADAVIFVDDGNHAFVHQGEQGVAYVERPVGVEKVLPGQQNLSHVNAVVAEIFFIGHHQLNLADGAESLLVVHVSPPAPFVDGAYSADSCPRGNHDDLFVMFYEIADLFYNIMENLPVYRSVVIGKHIASDLDDNFPALLD